MEPSQPSDKQPPGGKAGLQPQLPYLPAIRFFIFCTSAAHEQGVAPVSTLAMVTLMVASLLELRFRNAVVKEIPKLKKERKKENP